jgi:hypothetical protein
MMAPNIAEEIIAVSSLTHKKYVSVHMYQTGSAR